MKRQELKKKRQSRRKVAVKNNLTLVDGVHRLTVTKSNLHIYAQIIDDQNSVTKVSASTIDTEAKKQVGNDMNKVDQSKTVGKLLAERAKAANINKVVFDRNGFLYTGRIKALADAAREAGLEF